jgi:hypothetical protein
MQWLIWIGLMLAVPVLAGIEIWLRLNREARAAGSGQQEES